MKTLNNILWCAGLLVAATACTEEDYKLYDVGQKDSVFFEYRDNKNELVTDISYSYNYDIATVHTIEIPVTLMGMPAERDRHIAIVSIKDKTTMVEGVHYTIDDPVLPAGAINGIIKVNLLRDKDPQLLEQEFTLSLTIGENEDLRSVGENVFNITYSDIRPEIRPSWWTTWSPLPVYSFENAQLFFEYFHRLVPEANPTIYKEMVDHYGAYFEKATNLQGPMANYSTFLQKIVCLPMYNEHPEIAWQAQP